MPKYPAFTKEKGTIAYAAEKKYPEGKGLSAIIVNDEQKTMSLLGAAFYDCPQNDLFIIVVTGAKGRTTTAYFADRILTQNTVSHTALFLMLDRILGNKPEDGSKSDLTTPGSLDLFRDIHVAVNNGMAHLITEVSL